MAKKQATDGEPKPERDAKPDATSADSKAKPDSAAPPAGEPKAEKAEKAKKPRAPKEKTAPASPTPEQAGPPATAPAAAAAASPAGAPSAKKKGRPPGRPPRRGKKLRNHLRNLVQRLAKEGAVSVAKAIGSLKQMKRSKFDETVEIHMCLGIDVTQSDQLIRGTVPLPHGIGKSVRVAVFCQGDNVQKAKDAGADVAGGDDLIERVQKQNFMEFDVALATQDMMGKVSRLGKVLGPRGLMPTPKAGTVVTGDVGTAVREFKAGKVEFRTDKGGNVHAGVGKISFDDHKLTDNINSFVEAIRAAKPTGIKGNYIKSVTLCSTMSPGVAVTV
jgi:large subunit ribosomal protein L1